MSSARTYADELLARFTEPAQLLISEGTPAKPAKPAKDKHSCGLAADSGVCEGLRMAAKADSDSQTFAGIRSGQNGPESEHWRGFSQDSQLSQGVPLQCARGNAWTDADIARFLARRDRLMRWGWSQADAERLAERLALRDHDGDDRRMCVECRCLTQRGHCTAAKAGRLQGADRALEPVRHVLQRCEGFAPIVGAAADRASNS